MKRLRLKVQGEISLGILVLLSVCYVLSRIADVACSSRERKIVEHREQEKKKRIDSLYGR